MTDTKFYDERINTECGKIYQRGILYATLVALVYGIMHVWSLTSFKSGLVTVLTFSNYYVFFLPEATVFLFGIIILLVGVLLHGHPTDERELFEKHNYYLTAVKVFVIAAFIGYAVTIPFSTTKYINNVPLNYLVKLFETLGVIYLYYAFKKRDIFFNYSFIHENKAAYYKRVFLLIAKLAGILFLGFFGAALIDLAIHQSILNFWSILLAYVFSILGLGLEYLFISWLEKLSYDEKEHRGLHIGTFIKFIFLLFNTLLAFGVMMLLLQITNGSLGSMLINKGYHLGEIIAEITNIRNHFAHESSVLTAMVLCKFMCQIRNCKVARKAIGGIILLTSASLLLSYVNTFALIILQRIGLGATEKALQIFVSWSGVISILEATINAVLWTVLICDLVKTEKLSPLLWIVAGVRWFLTIFNAFSSFTGHQGATTFYATAGGILGLSSLILLLVLLHRHQYHHEHEEFV
ncbi:MAG: hypothetical protein E7661_04465 [Ruminococcaceae bacterium]|nr:hypothetical protein [Oscillospiraceae bacterium]